MGEADEGRAFYCGHCSSAQTGTHYRCQLSAGGFCEACDRDPGSAADGLVTGRTCRKCYDRNRRTALAQDIDEEEWTGTAQGKKKASKRRRSAEPREGAEEAKGSGTGNVGGTEPAKKKSKLKDAAKKRQKRLEEDELEELDYGFRTPWGEHNLPGGSEPPVLARRSARLKPIAYLEFFRKIQRENPDYRRVRDNALPAARREKVWDLMDEHVVDEYAWAIPDERALRIIQAIDIENGRKGVVEVGAGNGYWAMLMLERGVDVLAYDLYERDGPYAPVKKGTPEVVANHPHRILFLCYPDEFEESEESMALQCLEKFVGNYIIHVGELFGRSTDALSAWGRSTASEFQVRLVKGFHQVLSVPLPSWPFAYDTLTVWKRTNTLITEDGVFRDIPPNELIDACKAAPRYEDLLF